jgi:hypothetical protein
VGSIEPGATTAKFTKRHGEVAGKGDPKGLLRSKVSTLLGASGANGPNVASGIFGRRATTAFMYSIKSGTTKVLWGKPWSCIIYGLS